MFDVDILGGCRSGKRKNDEEDQKRRKLQYSVSVPHSGSL
jgi:hypothetical protein